MLQEMTCNESIKLTLNLPKSKKKKLKLEGIIHSNKDPEMARVFSRMEEKNRKLEAKIVGNLNRSTAQ